MKSYASISGWWLKPLYKPHVLSIQDFMEHSNYGGIVQLFFAFFLPQSLTGHDET